MMEISKEAPHPKELLLIFTCGNYARPIGKAVCYKAADSAVIGRARG